MIQSALHKTSLIIEEERHLNWPSNANSSLGLIYEQQKRSVFLWWRGSLTVIGVGRRENFPTERADETTVISASPPADYITAVNITLHF